MNETVKYKNLKLRCVKPEGVCFGCYFQSGVRCLKPSTLECSKLKRQDKQDVIFVVVK
jgi:hypothetical protein